MVKTFKEIEIWAGVTLTPGYIELLNSRGGNLIGSSTMIYCADDVIERNETFESKKYCPGFLAIGDDSGGIAFVIALGNDSSPVYAVDQGSMQPEDFTEVSPSIGLWLRNIGSQS
jgi:hypothetical protein